MVSGFRIQMISIDLGAFDLRIKIPLSIAYHVRMWGFMVQGLGFWVCGLGLRVEG